jgi:hypothetical protein
VKTQQVKWTGKYDRKEGERDNKGLRERGRVSTGLEMTVEEIKHLSTFTIANQ